MAFHDAAGYIEMEAVNQYCCPWEELCEDIQLTVKITAFEIMTNVTEDACNSFSGRQLVRQIQPNVSRLLCSFAQTVCLLSDFKTKLPSYLFRLKRQDHIGSQTKWVLV